MGIGIRKVGSGEEASKSDLGLDPALSNSAPVPSSSTAHPPTASSSPRPKPDYVLVLCYILVYLEVGWLIFMALRSYSRD